MQKLTIKSIERKEVNTPRGKTPTAIKLSLQANEFGNQWLGCFESEYTKSWKVGDIVEIDSIQQNGKYTNIVLPRKSKTNFAQAGSSQSPAKGDGEAIEYLRQIANNTELIAKILQRMDARHEPQFKPGDDVNLPSGGTTEDTDHGETPPPDSGLPF